MRKVEAENVQLHPHAADDANAFAEIDLSMARRMGERNKHLARSHPRQPHIVLHNGIAAGVAVLDPKAFEDPLRGMALLGRGGLVTLQYRVDHQDQRSKLWPFRRPRSNVARRRRIPAHLGDRVPTEPENARRFPPAIPLNENKLPDRRVNLHSEHPRAPLRIKVRRGSASKVAGFYAATRRTMPPLRGRLLRRRTQISKDRNRFRLWRCGAAIAESDLLSP